MPDTYDNAIAEVATPQITLGTGKYYIVPSTFNPGIDCGFRVLVNHEDRAVEVVVCSIRTIK